MAVKRAHMVSRSYLQPWGDDRGIVEVIDLEHGLGFRTAIVNATVASRATPTNPRC